MMVTSHAIVALASRCAAAARSMESDLNLADSRLGDGDTGTMLARLLTAVEATAACGNLGETFRAMAKAASGSTGSSLGTLVSAALLAMGRSCGDRASLPLTDLSILLKTARDEMLSLGRSELGDKTIIDGLDAIAIAVEACSRPTEIASAAMSAAQDAIQEFRGRPCRVGRARLWPERSMELDDPGMLALAAIVQAVGTKDS